VVKTRAVMTVCCMAMLTLSFTVAGLAMCMPSMARDLKLDYAQQGLVFSAPMWSFALSLVVAALADRIGFRGLLLAGSVVQTVGWFLLAEVQSLPQAVWAAALVGIGGSVVDPLLTPIICAVYPARRARMANFLHGFYCVGFASVALLIVLLHPGVLTWRWAFRVLGALCVPYGVASAVLALPRQVYQGEVRLRARTLMLRPTFWLLAVAMILAAATEMGPANWLPSFVQGLASPGDPTAGSNLLGGVGLVLFGSLMAAGRFMASAMETRIGVRRLLAGAAVACMVCLAAVALPFGTVYRVVCLGIVGFSVACLWPTLLAVAGDRFPQAGASMFSVLSAVGGLGCAAAPVALGCLGSLFGSLAPAMAALALAPALILIVSFRLRGGRRSPDVAGIV
jgi:MFS family permease